MSNSFCALGFDFGMRYIGVAVGQSITRTATSLTSLHAKDGIPDPREVQKLMDEWKPHVLIVGLPLQMDGTEQPITHCARKFGNRLKTKFNRPLHFVDERLTTWEAKMQRDSKTDWMQVNADAAAIILQQWFNEGGSL